MRLTGEPTDAALMSGRKRSIHEVEAAYAPRPRPAAPGVASTATSSLPPANKMRVDQDLLVQVLHAQLQGVIRDLSAHVSAQASSTGEGGALDRERALLGELEDLAGNLEQDWVVALLSSDKPQYGFPDVLAALKARVKASWRAGQSCRRPAGVC